MPRNITVTFQDGTNHVYQNAPDDITPEAVSARAQKEFGKSIASLDGGRNPALSAEIVSADVERQPAQWSELPGNIPESAGRLLSNMSQPILHPIETAKNLDNLVMGLGQKLIPGRQAQEQYPEALGNAISARYGSGEALKNTAITDPVGMLADVSGVVGGGSALLRGAGKLAASPAMVQAGKMGGRIATAIDPAVMAMKAPGAIARTVIEPVVSSVIGTTTGAGATALREAAKAGIEGGERATVFQQNMRGAVPASDIVQEAKAAVAAMKMEKGAEYQAGMANLGKDKTVLEFLPIRVAVAKAAKVGSFKGKRLDSSAGEVWEKINDVVLDWERSSPAQYHTPAGIDALKQSIGDIRDATTYGTPGRVVADRVYHAVRGQVAKQAPEYNQTMKGYEHASELIRDIENTLSVNPRANVDTTIRKLQSVMRNNANTNYGRRVDLAKTLEQYGAENLMPGIAGQALSSATPRGLQALGATGAGVTALAANPYALPAVAVTSPRLMGEAAYYGGKASKYIPIVPAHQSISQALLQSGRSNALNELAPSHTQNALAQQGAPYVR